jgi:hypothetical protein
MAAEEQRTQENAQIQKKEAFKKETHNCTLTSGKAAEAKASKWSCWECESAVSVTVVTKMYSVYVCVCVKLFKCTYRSYISHTNIYIKSKPRFAILSLFSPFQMLELNPVPHV